ncbi:MAG: M48 family metallopeptidase [Flavobacteriaceae bacterium]|nr:M48 family metallopeptidase [Flavobacteriaceae bacterium]
MKSQRIAGLTFLVLFVFSCATNPFTGKKTMAFVSNKNLFPMSFQQYEQVKGESKIITGTPEAEMIQRVGNKIKTAAQRWLDANGFEGHMTDYEWEFSLIDSDVVNAWAMPGGKVAFYTGILPIAANEAGVASIMGHEVAHALANHGQQRMSGGILQQIGAVGLAIGTGNQSPEMQSAWMNAYGAGSQVLGMLPFSRSHETEADKIGIQLMAIAGYEPDEAARLWERMKANSGGEAPPEFMSTHPSNDTRIDNLKQWSPEAKAEAKKFGVTSYTLGMQLTAK